MINIDQTQKNPRSIFCERGHSNGAGINDTEIIALPARLAFAASINNPPVNQYFNRVSSDLFKPVSDNNQTIGDRPRLNVN